MPTYDYECQECGHLFEHFQSINDPKLTDCPNCNKKKSLKRLIGGGSGIIFKGSGFYVTDYKNKSGSDSSSKSEAKSSSD